MASDGEALALDEGATACWFHVLMAGTWEGHPNGAFTIDEDKIDAMIERFNGNRTPMMIDWYHRSLEPRSVDDGKAAGFATKLEKRYDADGNPELWAYGEWNETALAMIRSGEIRYCSPVIDWESEDRKSGEEGVELFNIALTNQPFLDGQTAIQLHRLTRNGARTTMAKTPTATMDEPKDDPKAEEKPAEEPAKEDAPMADDAPGNTPDNSADMIAAMQLIAETSGLSAAEVVKAIVAKADAVAKILGDGGAEMVAASAALSAVTAELEDARAEVVALQAAVKASAETPEQEIEKYIACGRVKESRRAGALELLRSDRALFSRVWPEGSREVPIGGQTTKAVTEDPAASANVHTRAALSSSQRAAYDHLCKMTRGGKRLYTDAEALERTLKHTTNGANA